MLSLPNKEQLHKKQRKRIISCQKAMDMTIHQTAKYHLGQSTDLGKTL